MAAAQLSDENYDAYVMRGVTGMRTVAAAQLGDKNMRSTKLTGLCVTEMKTWGCRAAR